MGLIGPEEVPDTFFIANVQPAEGGYKGGEMAPVKIADIVEANGPQNPPATEPQHDFRFQIYLLHGEGREPDPQKLAQARAIEAMVLKYFDAARGRPYESNGPSAIVRASILGRNERRHAGRGASDHCGSRPAESPSADLRFPRRGGPATQKATT